MKTHHTQRTQKHLAGVESSPKWGWQARLRSGLRWFLDVMHPLPTLVTSAALALGFHTSSCPRPGSHTWGDTVKLPSGWGWLVTHNRITRASTVGGLPTERGAESGAPALGRVLLPEEVGLSSQVVWGPRPRPRPRPRQSEATTPQASCCDCPIPMSQWGRGAAGPPHTGSPAPRPVQHIPHQTCKDTA